MTPKSAFDKIVSKPWMLPICWILDHDWLTIEICQRKYAALCHLHSMAGCTSVCVRCGTMWDDFPREEWERKIWR